MDICKFKNEQQQKKNTEFANDRSTLIDDDGKRQNS